MDLIEHDRGPDWEYYIFDNVIPGLENINPHAWFEGTTSNDFYFKNDHKIFKLEQYGASEEVHQVAKTVTEELKRHVDIHPVARLTTGVHQLSYEEGSEHYVGTIPPHWDLGHDSGFTIFLNREWPIERGGFNLVISKEENRVVKVTTPRFNRGILIKMPCLHAAGPIWTPAVRRTLQLFYTFQDTELYDEIIGKRQN